MDNATSDIGRPRMALKAKDLVMETMNGWAVKQTRRRAILHANIEFACHPHSQL
jgi:hypothetical protein